MIFELGEQNRIYPPDYFLWTYHGTDEGEHLFSRAEGKITWLIPPHLLRNYKFVKNENTKRDEA